MHLTAYADLWARVDEQGITHFAASQVDERYQLFFKGSDLAALEASAGEPAAKRLASPADTRLGLKPGQGGDGPGAGEPRFVVPKRFANLHASSGYKSVQKHLRAAAKTYQVDYELIKAVIAAESGFNPEAVSPKGAVGLMQLMPPTAQQYGVLADKEGRKDARGQPLPALSVEQKLVDPQTNINAGARYLAYLIKLFKGELSLAVAAYNAGEGAVQRAGNKIPNYKETQGYVKTVMGLYSVFKPESDLASTADTRAGRAQPVARAAARVNGRVRVELAGAGAAPRVERSAATAAPEAAAVLTPVVFTRPTLSADTRLNAADSGS